VFGSPPGVALLACANPVALILWVDAGGNRNDVVKLDSLGTLAPVAWPIPFLEEPGALCSVRAAGQILPWFSHAAFF
jgi:hypothetical protein